MEGYFRKRENEKEKEMNASQYTSCL